MKREVGGGAARGGRGVSERGEERKEQEYKKERLCLVLMKSDKDVIQVEQCQCEKFEL